MTPTEKDLLEVTELRKGLPADIAKKAKYEVLHELFLRVEKEHEKALKSAYPAGRPMNIEAAARASGLGSVLAMIVGFQNNL